jgi:hypothetical protein
MMEVTMTEMWLFVWAIGATAYAINRHDEARTRTQMLHLILEDKEARADILAKFDKFKESIHASKS